MKYGSVCSGIEAASKAWEPLGWKPAWFSEIEPFPSAVLAHHWPEITNLGDMTQIADAVRTGNVEAPDVLVGGTPCQAFSIAGLREGLSDYRGQLTLSYVELANAIDAKRRERGEPESIIVWENVPGVLSSKDNAFGCFLAGLVGESSELQPAGGKWTHAGCVSGPERVIAWRVLDAQFFGVAQRRRRVFVVASARKGFDPAEVLFEFDSVRRDSAPRRETQKAVAALTARGVGTCGADDNQAQAGHLIAQCANGDVSHTLKGEGFDGSEDGTGRGVPVVAFGGGNTAGHIDVATACTAHGIRLDFDTETFAVHGTQDPDTNRELAHTLGRNNGQENACIAFSYKDNGADATSDLSPTIRAGNQDKSHANSGQPPAIAYAFKAGQGAKAGGIGYAEEQSPTLTSASSGTNLAPAVMHGIAVRRLTPIECERLQGFPDNHTLIGWRGKDATECPDGPRYKAIGNSMAVPVMRWIGERIAAALPAEKLNGDYGGSKTPLEQRDLWRTPPALFASLDAEFCFQLDAAAAPYNALCRRFITAEQNTLETPWADYLNVPGYVWLNPPYSDITPFVKKAAAESANQIGTVMLVPADTSVGWFKEAIQTASEVRFITAGRLAFINPVTGKPVSGNNKGSMLIIWRPYPRTHCHFATVDRDELMAFGAKLLSRREAA
ncbi:TPA: phage N-6-adenine-methyltransferase [Enterobacter hormaechei subsp. xiangfangensis]|nr:phage N-6-adenine-methyltransferase [Enterobacter hormaechei]MCW4828157.1 phage N-6-adenine-methyltransferase [Enterobacter hormaechei subsp. xiangfangensis]MCW4962867.1 phage N-6-adenine-methyltransferase [Enterobacter hormaechei subsp. xiangfangensis]HAS0863689.1 phage N-6-adenine-methyltransferase [Enterobacter hormaechei subsp. xiangfangensis]HAV1664472.1 phage N-6-adenine-methyltransferase [Enterobacter hormaechei subsp. xiangfangensis]HCM9487028.1 phage N-6-adenine-methyltransferase [